MTYACKPLFSALALVLLALPAAAQDAPARFSMEKTESGIVRLDTVTGEMSLCRERDEQIVCTVAADERRAFEDEIADLDRRIAALEQSLANGAQGGRQPLPSDEEINRTMGIMEKFMRQFFDIVEDLNRDFRSGEPDTQKVQPEKT